MNAMNFSPQSQSVYKILLNSNHPLTVKAIAKEAKLSPSLTYRLINPLCAIGLVAKFETRPYQFKAKSIDEGLSMFLVAQNEWFLKQFSENNRYSEAKNNLSESNQINFSFIQSRDELMNRSTEELRNATKSVDLLRSGHEIPAETMLSMFEAKKRGVKVRMLIQDYSEEKSFQIRHWVKNGIQVRKTSLHHMRIMIYDSSIAYFMSYKHEDSAKDLGMKISYQPFATILSNLFDDWWQKAEKI